MTDPNPPQPTSQDQEHLRLLSVFHYVVAGLTGLFGCLPILHLIVGISILTGSGPFGRTSAGPPLPHLFGVFFIVIAVVMISWFWATAILNLVAARALVRQRRYTLCLVTAGFDCMFMPFGTVLGVFTIIVLMRPSVKALFQPA